jgi:hypothetical protein
MASAQPTEADLPTVNGWVGLAATAAAMALIAMREIDRLSAAVLDAKGRSWSFAELMGPSTVVDRSADGWAAGAGTFDVAALNGWLREYLIVDFVFILVYSSSLWLWFKNRYRLAARLVLAIGAIDLLEDALAWLAGRNAEPITPGLLQDALPWVSAAKFILVLLTIAALVRRFFSREAGEAWRGAARRLLRAVYTHRFSVLAIVPIAILSVIPGADLLDQLPDVQRQWTDDTNGRQHALVAGASVGLLAITLFALGRLRSDFAWRRAHPTSSGVDDRPKPALWLWLAAPVLIPVLALLSHLAGVQGFSLERFRVFVGVPLLIFALSWVLRRRLDRPPGDTGANTSWVREHVQRPTRPRPTSADVRTIARTGDVLAVAALVIGGLGLVRSFTAVLALGAPDTSGRALLQPLQLLLIGIVGALVVWPLAAWALKAVTAAGLNVSTLPAERRFAGWVLATLTPGVPTTSDGQRAVGRWLRVGLLVGSFVGFVAIGVTPVLLAEGGGVIACAVLSLTFFAVMIGAMVVIAQDGGSPEIFWLPHLRFPAAPIATLLVLTLVFASQAGGEAEVHGIRGLAPAPAQATGAGAGPTGVPAAPDPRPNLTKAFQDWQAGPSPCGHLVKVGDRNVRLRPMLLVAAEGGGIRATYWTVAALQLMAKQRLTTVGSVPPPPASTEAAGCGARATLLSGGASGGAVGLAVSRFAGSTLAVEQVTAMASPKALGSASVGLFVRDLLYSATGVPLPVLGSPDVVSRYGGSGPGTPWADRAALMESVWETESAALQEPFVPPRPAGNASVRPEAPTGHLVLSSTSVATGCRMFVSQLALPRRMPGPIPATSPSPIPRPSASAEQPSPTVTPPVSEGEESDVPANGACDALGSPAPGSVDLLQDYAFDIPRSRSDEKLKVSGRAQPADKVAPGQSDDRCISSLRASTAAMLASRFPYVTPSGVVGPCHGWPLQQLVDGGYVENTGLGTLIDLSFDWLTLVRAQNTAALIRPKSADPVDVVVPVVVYLDNGTGSDLTAPTRKITSELLVPPVATGRAGKAQSDTPALLQRVGNLISPTNLWDDTLTNSDGYEEAVRSWRPLPVIVVHQSTVPAVTAPLGWVLSADSIATMDQALKDQSETSCVGRTQDALCVRGFGSLKDVLDLLEERPPQ